MNRVGKISAHKQRVFAAIVGCTPAFIITVFQQVINYRIRHDEIKVLTGSHALTSLTLPLVLDMSRVHLTDEQFYQLCVSNCEIPLERNAQGGHKPLVFEN